MEKVILIKKKLVENSPKKEEILVLLKDARFQSFENKRFIVITLFSKDYEELTSTLDGIGLVYQPLRRIS